MPIEVKHSGNAAGTAVSSYAGGQAKRQVAAVQSADRRASELRSAYDRDTIRTRPSILRPERPAIQGEDPDFETKFSDAQRQNFNQLADQRDKLKDDPTLTDDEKAEADQKLAIQQDAVQPSKQMKVPKHPSGLQVGETKVDPNTGDTLTLTSKGELEVLSKSTKEAEAKRRSDAREAERKRASDEYDADFNRFTTEGENGKVTDIPAMMKYRAQREAILGGTYSPSDDTDRLDSEAQGLDPEQSAALTDEMQIEAGQRAREARLAQTERTKRQEGYMIRTKLSEAPAAVGETAKLTVEAPDQVFGPYDSRGPTGGKGPAPVTSAADTDSLQSGDVVELNGTVGVLRKVKTTAEAKAQPKGVIVVLNGRIGVVK